MMKERREVKVNTIEDLIAQLFEMLALLMELKRLNGLTDKEKKDLIRVIKELLNILVSDGKLSRDQADEVMRILMAAIEAKNFEAILHFATKLKNMLGRNKK